MQRTLRVAGGVIGGYLVMAAIVIIGVMLAARLLVEPGATPGADYLAANVLVSFIAAVAGGYCAALIGREDRRPVTILLAGIVLALGLLVESGQGQPGWYALVIPATGVGGTLFGGLAAVHFARSRQQD